MTPPRPRRSRRLAVLLILAAAAGAGMTIQEIRIRQDRLDHALIAAVKKQDTPGVERLLLAGANPDYQQQRTVNVSDVTHRHSLPPPTESLWIRLRRWMGLTRQAEILLGDAPLHITAVNRDGKTARALLAHGAQVDIRDLGGNTPLTRSLRAALFVAHTDYVQPPPDFHASLHAYVSLLLAYRADPNATCCDLATPLNLVERLPDRRIAALLRQSGANGKHLPSPCGQP